MGVHAIWWDAAVTLSAQPRKRQLGGTSCPHPDGSRPLCSSRSARCACRSGRSRCGVPPRGRPTASEASPTHSADAAARPRRLHRCCRRPSCIRLVVSPSREMSMRTLPRVVSVAHAWAFAYTCEWVSAAAAAAGSKAACGRSPCARTWPRSPLLRWRRVRGRGGPAAPR